VPNGELGTISPGLARPPRPSRSPVGDLLLRTGFAVGLLLVVALTVYLGRDGYVDATGAPLSFLAAVYYASVSVTTTGYGDITPVTSGARLATILIVTPARIGFLLLLVGTTIELLTERWRDGYRRERWRRDVKDHTIICGYGVKGRAALRALRDDGVALEDIVVIEPRPESAVEANRARVTVVSGDATRADTLREARIERARAVIIATDRDDSAVLITLTARELGPQAHITVAVREEENKHLLERSGADAVITSSETAGRLLGITSRNPDAARIVEDLLDTAHGLMLVERSVTSSEVGGAAAQVEGQVPIGVLRDGRLLRIDEEDCLPLRETDLVVSLAGAVASATTQRTA
jgi:voltage-gated potassium channel